MALQELGFRNIPNLDMGTVDAMFANLLEHVVADCLDRPGDKKARVIKMECAITPVMTGDVCDGVKTEFKMNAGIPAYVSKTHHMAVRKMAGVISQDEWESLNKQIIDRKDDPWIN